MIRLSSFGDIVLSFMLLKSLREAYPSAKIDFITKDKYKDVVHLSRDVNEVLSIDNSLLVSRKKIKNEKYDLIIDIHRNFRSLILRFVNAKHVVKYNKENIKKFLLVKFKWNFFRQVIPVWRKYVEAATDYLPGKDFSFSGFDLNFDKARKIRHPYIVIAPSARHFTKTFPADKFIEIIGRYLKSGRDEQPGIVLVGDESERDTEICRKIEMNSNGVVNMCGGLSIRELANVLYNSEYVICNDSSVLHLSEALGKRAVAIFGSTVKEFGFFPQLVTSEVKEVRDLHCRPCTHIGRDKCPRGHFKCMKEIQFSIEA